MITLNLDRDFDAWKPEDARSLADTVAESAGVAKEHVKILDCQRLHLPTLNFSTDIILETPSETPAQRLVNGLP
jgi:hypothetical protein